uniref:Uncharacterized protein n=1 Tax=Onchocerca volvulus TaxID=6282 RepID=A0A8R1TTU2_ONCVO
MRDLCPFSYKTLSVNSTISCSNIIQFSYMRAFRNSNQQLTIKADFSSSNNAKQKEPIHVKQ